MRDIRNDLQERANLIDEQIKVAYAHFENAIQQLKTEREAKIADLQSGIAMIANSWNSKSGSWPKCHLQRHPPRC